LTGLFAIAEHEEEFSYVLGAENGPEHWGAIKEEWAACGAGRMQSPIDVSDARVTLARPLGYLNHSYRPAEASIVNRGHDIMVRIRWQGRGIELIPAPY
jgi:carbonic anhydrase